MIESEEVIRNIRIAVLIPCHNEESTIAKVVGDFYMELDWQL